MYYPYLEHSGVKGMHWGVRRYQNHDGSLTPAGRAHYGVGPARKFKTTVGSALKAVKKGGKNVVRSAKKMTKAITNAKREKAERKKEVAIESGNVKKILRSVKSMSDPELKAALSRAQTVKTIKDLKKPDKDGVQKIQDVISIMEKGSSAVSKFYKARQEKIDWKSKRDAYEDARRERFKKRWEEDRKEKLAKKDRKAEEKRNKALQDAKELNERLSKLAEDRQSMLNKQKEYGESKRSKADVDSAIKSAKQQAGSTKGQERIERLISDRQSMLNKQKEYGESKRSKAKIDSVIKSAKQQAKDDKWIEKYKKNLKKRNRARFI